MRPLVSQANGTDAAKPGFLVNEDAESGLSIGDIFRTITKRWLFIALCIMICTGLSYLYMRTVTPIYEAGGTIRIDPGRTGSIGLSSIASQTGAAQDEIGTDIAIFKSDSVAVETLNTLTDEEFRSFAGGSRSQLAFSAETIKLTPAQESLLAKLKGGLDAKEVATTQLISVSFRSPDPRMAATIANAAMSAYLKVRFDNQYTSVKQVRTWLSGQMEDLRNQAITAQNKLAQFQEMNNILVTGENSNTTIDALKSVSTDLTKARADRINAEAQMRGAEDGEPEVIAAIFPSPTMTALVGQRATLNNQINQLSAKFDVNYPPLQESRLALEKNTSQIQREITLIRARVRQQYDTAAATERLLQGQYDEELNKAYALNRQEATYSVLVAETKSTRDLYNELEHSLQQAGISAGLSAVDSMLVDRARAPFVPVEPKKTVILGFGFMVGLFCGLGTAFLRDLIIDTPKNEKQLEGTLRSHVLAAIAGIPLTSKSQTLTTPPTDTEQGNRISPTIVAFQTPRSRAAEAYRNLRNGLLLSGERLKTVLVTSTIAGEGKSTTVLNLAVVLAQSGASVLVIDGDLRRPRIHTLLGIKNLVGLSSLILGEKADSDPIQHPITSLPNLSVLTAGRQVTLPAETLGSSRFYHLLETWEKTYDYILIDSAPLLIVSDSLPMSKWADATILVVRYNLVSVAALRRVRTLISHAQINLVGLVFNDLPLKDVSYGGYGYQDGYYE